MPFWYIAPQCRAPINHVQRWVLVASVSILLALLHFLVERPFLVLEQRLGAPRRR
jgi:hypothetical protein